MEGVKQMTSIIYLRVSTSNKRNKVDADGKVFQHQQDPLLQLKPIHEAFPESKMAEVYVEKGSAYKNDGNLDNRPVFKEVVKKIEEGGVSHLYLFDLDRAFRNRGRSMQLFELCAQKKCKLYTVNQKWLINMQSIEPESVRDLMMSIMSNMIAYISEEDSRNKSEKIKSAVRREEGQKAMSANGRKWGRKERITPEQVQKMKELRSQGMSLAEIGRQFLIFDKNKGRMVNLPAKTIHEKLKTV